MKDGRTFLKVKIKNLADEARTIRQETAKAPDPAVKNRLAVHRRTTVRQAARSTQLAYAFIRGRGYRSAEPKTYSIPNSQEIRRMVKQYGVDQYSAAKAEELARLESWLSEASKPTAVMS